MADTAEIREYRAFVNRVAETDRSRLIVDKDTRHASILLSKIFDLSERQVELLTGCLDPAVYGADDLLCACGEFLKRNAQASIRILSESPIRPDHPFVHFIQNEGLGDRLEISVVPPELQDYKYHFAVGDGAHFRFEPNKNVREAFVKFDDPSDGAQLQSAFDELNHKVREYSRERQPELVG